MDILSRETLAFLKHPTVRAAIDRLLNRASSRETVVVGPDTLTLSVVDANEPSPRPPAPPTEELIQEINIRLSGLRLNVSMGEQMWGKGGRDSFDADIQFFERLKVALAARPDAPEAPRS